MSIDTFFKYVDKNQDKFVNELREWVSIPSVSAFAKYRQDCARMVLYVGKRLEGLGAKTRVFDNPAGTQIFSDGSKAPYPPIIVSELGNNPSHKTVCVYGHLDVQPAEKSDGWSTEPFELTEIDNVLWGRGSTDDKGPVLGWLAAIESFQKCGITLPLNIKFIFEAMEESGSVGLKDFIEQHKEDVLKGIDFVCISDNYWLGTKKPCVTYGLRGIMYFGLTVSGPKCDLHSGSFGGILTEPMTDLIRLLGQLVDHNGRIMVPGINDDIAVLSQAESEAYKSLDFDTDEFRKSIEVSELLFESKEEILMHRWRYPSLSIHGIEGAFSQSGSKTVIPAKVIGKFSIRIVPNMQIEVVKKHVVDYLNGLHSKVKSSNKIHVELFENGPPWVSDFNNENYIAARNATKTVYGVEPDLTREGGSIPITMTFEEQFKKSVVLLPMGRGDDGAHSQNEKLDRSNFINGIKLLGAYLLELTKL